MDLYKETVSFLENAFESDLTSLQKMIVYLNIKLPEEKIDVVKFASENHLIPCLELVKLFSYGYLVENFWNTLEPLEIEKYKDNLSLFLEALASYEKEIYSNTGNLEYLKKYEISDIQNKIPNLMLKELSDNKKLVEENINYLLNLGILNIKDIFEKYYELFLMDNSNFIDIFNKYDREDLIAKLEKNVGILEYL